MDPLSIAVGFVVGMVGLLLVLFVIGHRAEGILETLDDDERRVVELVVSDAFGYGVGLLRSWENRLERLEPSEWTVTSTSAKKLDR